MSDALSGPTLYLAGILALGIMAQWLAWRARLPAIILLLLFGFLIGQGTNPDELIPVELMSAAVSLSVAVILFEGGMSLKLREIQDTGSVVVRLVTIGVFVTWVLTALAAWILFDFTPLLATLVGALLTVSGPTVILPLLRHIHPARKIGSLVKWEGIVNDPIGAVLAALVFEVLRRGGPSTSAGGGHAMGESVLGLVYTALIGGGLALVSAAVLIGLLKRYLIPDYLQNGFFLAVVVSVFVASNMLQAESGLVTVTLLGILLANQRSVTVHHVIEFKENLRVLLISTLFIVLASRIEFQQIVGLGWPGLAFLLILLLVVRPAAVFLATIGSEMTYAERLLLAWLAPRGIVAAAVASLFAFELVHLAEEGQVPQVLGDQAETFVAVVFLVIVGTVFVYGVTTAPLARLLKLSHHSPQGVLFAGAEAFVRSIATALKEEGFQVVLVDTNHPNIAAARMAGLPVCYASIGSEFVHDEIELGGIGRLLAMTPNDEVNALATLEFSEHFSRAGVYQLVPHSKKQREETLLAHRLGRPLFGSQATFRWLSDRVAGGAQIKKTTISEGFTLDDFQQMYGPDALVLFMIEEPGKLTVCTADQPPAPKAGQKLISLVDAAVDEKANES